MSLLIVLRQPIAKTTEIYGVLIAFAQINFYPQIYKFDKRKDTISFAI